MNICWLTILFFILGLSFSCSSLQFFGKDEKKEGEGEAVKPQSGSPFFEMSFGEYVDAVQKKFDEWSAHGMPLDARETKEGFEVLCDIPGVKREDLKVSVTGNKLKIEAHREAISEVEGVSFEKIERSSGDFSRSLYLPNNADISKLTAQYRDGVLHVSIPKTCCDNEEEMDEPAQAFKIL